MTNKTLGKTLSLLLAVCMVLPLLPVTARADGNTIVIDNQAAWTALTNAPDTLQSGDTITLTGNVSGSLKIPLGVTALTIAGIAGARVIAGGIEAQGAITLTLKNIAVRSPSCSAILFMNSYSSDACSTLHGEGMLTLASEQGDAIRAGYGSLTITGTVGDIAGSTSGICTVSGDITITGQVGHIAASGAYNNGGIYVHTNGNVLISGTVGDIHAPTARGISASGPAGLTSITETGTVGNIVAMTGLYAYRLKVYGTVGDITAAFAGILVTDDITLSGTMGTILSTGTEDACYGINTNGGTITINTPITVIGARQAIKRQPVIDLAGPGGYTATWSNNMDGSSATTAHAYTWAESHKYVKIEAPVSVDSASALATALQGAVPSIIALSDDITFTSAATMGASHTLVVPDGKTLTIGDGGIIDAIGRSLTIRGGGTVTVAKAGGHGICLLDDSVLTLETITVNLNNTRDSGGISAQVVNVNRGATVVVNTDTADVIAIQKGQTWNVNSGGAIDIQNFSAAGLSVYNGALNIHGGTVTVGVGAMDNYGIRIGSEVGTARGTLAYTSGTLTSRSGGRILFVEGTTVTSVSGTFVDRGTVFTAADPVTVGSSTAAPSATGLAAGKYVWDNDSGAFIAAMTRVTDQVTLVSALTNPNAGYIKMDSDISLTLFVKVDAKRCVLDTNGKTLTISNEGQIYFMGGHLTLCGGGTVTIANTIEHGLCHVKDRGTLNFENVAVKLQNTDAGGICANNVNVDDGATVTLNSASGGALIKIDANQKWHVNTGGVIAVQQYKGNAIVVSGTLHIHGGTVALGTDGDDDNSMYCSGTLEYTSGTLDGHLGGSILLLMNATVKGLNGQLNDQGMVLAQTGTIVVGALRAEPSEDALSSGRYAWNGSMFEKAPPPCFLGAGTPESPYQITSAEDLEKLAELVNAQTPGYCEAGVHYTLMQDIDLSGCANWTPIGDGTDPAGFKGVFIGGCKVISGLTLDTDSASLSGLFGFVNGGTVQCLGLTNVNIKNGYDSLVSCTGAVAGQLDGGGAVQNCYVTGKVSGTSSVGGVAGYLGSGTVQNCCVTATVSGSAVYVGGVVGYVMADSSTKVTNCAALNASVQCPDAAGRVVGKIGGSGGEVSGNVAFDGMAGGTFFNTGTSKDLHGVDKTAIEINTTGFFQSVFDPKLAANVWSYAAGKLPGLGALRDMPEHLQLPPLVFSDQGLPNGTCGKPYEESVPSAEGGSGSYTYASDGLAKTVPGLNLSSDGKITGVPTAAVPGRSFIVTATDAVLGTTAEATCTLTIDRADAPDAVSHTEIFALGTQVSRDVNLTALLPRPDAPIDYGAVSCAVTAIDDPHSIVTEPVLDAYFVDTMPITVSQTAVSGQLATIRLEVESENVETFTLDITVQIADLETLPTPAAVIDYIDGCLTGLDPNEAYIINGVDITADSDGTIAIFPQWQGASIGIVKKGDRTTCADSGTQTLHIPGRPPAPKIGKTDTTNGLANGTLTGVDSMMAYTRDDLGPWTACTGTTVTGLAAGTYKVRVQPVPGVAFESFWTVVTIADSVAPPPSDGGGSGGGSSGGGSSGGGSGSGGSAAAPKPPQESTIPASGGTDDTGETVAVPASVDAESGAVTLCPDAKTTEKLTDAAQKAARAHGEAATPAITLDLSAVAGATSAKLAAETAKAFAGAGADVTIKLPGTQITLGADTLAALAQAPAGDGAAVTVAAAVVPMADLGGLQAAQVREGQTVASIDIFVGKTQVDVPVTISLPYTLKAGETPDGVCVWHLDDAGSLTRLDGVYDAETGMMTFRVGHQSYFVVGYDPAALWINTFSDVSDGAWYYDAVAFAGYHGLFSGDGRGHFMPQSAMTRAMLATVLWNLEGKPAPAGPAAFVDVADEWYADAVSWAAESGIVSGVGGGRFAPGAAVTRQEMAVMLLRYAAFKGLAMPANRDMPRFTDAGQIDVWAETAVRKLAEAGVVNGADGMLMPQKTATRAEVAQTFKRFLRLVAGK